jgi:PAS domain S-box-containing protein
MSPSSKSHRKVSDQEPLGFVLEYVQDYAIFLMDLDGHITSWNPGAQQLKGYTEAEAVGQHFRLLFTPEEVARRQPEREIAYTKEHGIFQDEVVRMRKDGSRFDAQVTLSLIRAEDGTPRGFVKVTRDISERKALQRELAQRKVFQEELLGIVSHDLRSPLNAVLLGAALLRQEELTARQSRAVGRIVSSAERGIRLVHDLLDFTEARLGHGLTVRTTSLDLHDLARHIVDEVQLLHPHRTVEVHSEGMGHGEWDPDRLAQLLTNLLNNALAYGEHGRPVSVTTRGTHAGVELEVHSWGEPIPEELKPVLFERLTRGVNKHESQKGSVGLGLFIVSHIARAHGGQVEVESTREAGTTFRVKLPRTPAPPGR